MVLATNLGFPRIGARRALKKAVEGYWKGRISKETLQQTAKELRLHHWRLQKEAGLYHIPSHDFCLYDQVLSMATTLGCIPARYNWDGGRVTDDLYFAMARGSKEAPAMEMTKWFDTNYHYIVPEFEAGQSFKLSCDHIFDVYDEAKNAGIETRPVLVGPVTFLILGKESKGFDGNRIDLLDDLLPVYIEILQKLQSQGAQWVQIDEPCLVLDLDETQKQAYKNAYDEISKALPDLDIVLTTYFDTLRDNAELAFGLPVNAVHIDLCRNPGQANTAANTVETALDQALSLAGDKVLSLGIVDGRNIWRNDLRTSLQVITKAVEVLGPEKVWVGPSCSLLHTPVDLEAEQDLDAEIKSWLAFAVQKLDEIVTLAKGASEGEGAISQALVESDAVQESRRTSTRIHNQAVKTRMAELTPEMTKRDSDFKTRQAAQRAVLDLPLYPTTSIGSFPQTQEIRRARAAYKRGELNDVAYEQAMQDEIKAVVDYQHEIGIDVLVHGEPERNDMVEYFGEQLSGFAFTKHGWVQSYGSRCVKPPIIYGDVSRPDPMTVKWSEYAQSLTDHVMKGMLTGPVTILQWSFVRDDQPRMQTAKQIALAIRDEVRDLEAAGIKMIQIDEAAFREGLPLRQSDWENYLDSAVANFRLASCGVKDETQIHTHMCYSEFNDIIKSIAAMDADVISIETSRSQMELLDAFVAYKYPNEIGPGVYDIHSPRVPTVEAMVELLEKANDVLASEQLWVNPDCGLKTRGWAEVEPALKNMVTAAKKMREKSGAVQAA